MSAANLKFIDVTFSYQSSEPIISSLNLHFARGWTGIVGPNGAGKSTVAKLAAGILTPTAGTVVHTGPLRALYCEQDTAELPDGADRFMSGTGAHSGKLRSLLGIEDDWIERWRTLSHGERKRFQAGVALWSEPDILVLDEPVNHVDMRTKDLLLTSLRTFKGIGIIVSHERSFLDALCDTCLFMRPGEAVLRRGNFSKGFEQQELEDEARERKYLNARAYAHDMKKRANLVKQRESAKENRLTKRGIARHDHDAKGRIDGARLTGKDKTGSRKAKLLANRAEESAGEASSLYFKQRKVEGILFRGERSMRDSLFQMDTQSIPLGPAKRLFVPDLRILPADRIAIIGDNGTGKSTLLNFVVRRIHLAPGQVVYIPQEIDTDLWDSVNTDMMSLAGRDAGLVYTAVHRLGSEPDRVIGSQNPSPGEKRKIMLALGLLKKPSILIMDEPTNHMDMPSIRCIEDALRQFTGALVVVSHDPVFIRNTSETVWELRSRGTDTELRIADIEIFSGYGMK